MDHPQQYGKERRPSSSPTTTRRREAVASNRYIAPFFVLSLICIVSTLPIVYFELNSMATSTITEANTVVESSIIEAPPHNPSHHRVGLTIHNAASVGKISTTGFGPGQFCAHCSWNEDVTCSTRLNYLMTKYNMNKTVAEASLMERCPTPLIPHNVYTADDEPSIILHVGPHKTGTTTLQSFIYDLLYKKKNKIFLEDNLRIPLGHELPGPFGHEGVGLNLPHCCINRYKTDGGQSSEKMCAAMRKAFPNFVADAYNKSQNILVVAEDFDRSLINFNRLHFYLRPYKKIKVISTYRRLHEWFPSWYNQIIAHYKLIYASGDDKFPSFVEWLSNNYDEFLKAHGVTVAERFNSYAFIESAHLINMHDMGDGLVESFFCNILQAKALCEAIKEGAKPSKHNVGLDHEYLRLAIEAKLAGKIPESSVDKKIHQSRTSRLLRMRVEETNITLPILCPSKQILDKIFTQELDYERKYFPEWFESQGGEEALRKSFEKAAETKFCAYDVVKIFDTGIMDGIFSELN